VTPRALRWADAAGAQAGLEHCEVRPAGAGLAVASVVAGTIDGLRFGLSYALTLDAGWQVDEAQLLTTAGLALRLDRDGAGWRVGGRPAPHLEGCIDIDIRATPLTNTLPIRRLALGPAQSAEIEVAYVDVPSLTVARARQRYTRLDDSTIRFESLESGFTADLPVDAEGFVTDYPGLFRRLA
jgi:hypothetical protein